VLVERIVDRLGESLAERVAARLKAEPAERSFVSVRNAAERLDCSKAHVFDLIQSGLLDAFVVGKLTRISRASLDRYCANAAAWRPGSGRGGNRRRQDPARTSRDPRRAASTRSPRCSWSGCASPRTWSSSATPRLVERLEPVRRRALSELELRLHALDAESERLLRQTADDAEQAGRAALAELVECNP